MKLAIPLRTKAKSVKAKQTDARMGLAFVSDQALCVIQMKRVHGKKPQVTFWDYYQFNESSDRHAALKRATKNFKLATHSCITLLSEQSYQIKSVEALPVPPQELANALVWKVKDMVDIPMENLTLEVIEFPSTVIFGENERFVYAVAAKISEVKGLINELQAAKVNLDVIDIPEMAQRNIATLLPEEEFGVATISFSEKSTLIVLSKKGNLYMSRRLDIGLKHINKPDERQPALDRIVVEVQRSLDYYSSNLRQASIKTIYLLPTQGNDPSLLAHIKDNLFLDTHYVDFGALLDWKDPMPLATQEACFLCIGVALRKEDESDGATN